MFDVIGFDADDTLWHNESIFTMTQKKFREILSSHGPEVVDQTLSSTQINNLEVFGYGIKGFILSMIETSIEITDGEIQGNEIQQILNFGREMLAAPIELLPYVQEVVDEEVHSGLLGSHVTRVGENNAHHLYLMFDILQIFLLEYFVFKHKLLAGLLLDNLAQSLQIVNIQIPIQVNLFAKLHNPL